MIKTLFLKELPNNFMWDLASDPDVWDVMLYIGIVMPVLLYWFLTTNHVVS